MNGRRTVRATPELIADLLLEGKTLPAVRIETGLPEGARLVDIGLEGSYAVVATFEHDSWPEGSTGEIAPHFSRIE